MTAAAKDAIRSCGANLIDSGLLKRAGIRA